MARTVATSSQGPFVISTISPFVQVLRGFLESQIARILYYY